jgi:hypothetical protein
MRQVVTLVIVGSLVVALLAFVGSQTRPADDDLARSITAMVETTR